MGIEWYRGLTVVCGLCFVGCSRLNPLFDPGADQDAGGEGTGGEFGASSTTGEDGAEANGAGTEDAATSGPTTNDSTEDTEAHTSTAGATTPSFVDEVLDGQFAAGIWTNLEWDRAHMQLLAPGAPGTLLSRVYDSGAPTHWSSIEWSPLAPYGKPLPDGGQSESGYPHGNANGSELALLMHFDAPIGEDENVALVDSSGNGLHGEARGADAAFRTNQQGVFGGALVDDGPRRHVLLDTEALAPGVQDFTWAMWYRADACEWEILLSFDFPDPDADLAPSPPTTPSVWMLCGCDGGLLPGMDAGVTNNGGGPFDCAGPGEPLEQTGWHHLAMVKEGHNQSTVRVYIDGEMSWSSNASYDDPLSYTEGVEFTLGGGLDDLAPHGEGQYDDVAVFQRALSPDELRSLYQRGTLRLEFEVRACDEPDCADDPPFVGPDGTGSTRFRDPDDALGPGTPLQLPELYGRYVQYRSHFAAPAGNSSPGLARVEIRGETQ